MFDFLKLKFQLLIQTGVTAKFHQIGQKVAEIWHFIIFFKDSGCLKV